MLHPAHPLHMAAADMLAAVVDMPAAEADTGNP
jgi:hypothetical protein